MPASKTSGLGATFPNMAYKPHSDLSGEVVDHKDLIPFHVLAHPEIDKPKQLDVSKDDVAGLDTAAKPAVHIRVNGQDLTMTEAAFKKLFKGTQDVSTVLAEADPLPATDSAGAGRRRTTSGTRTRTASSGPKEGTVIREWARENGYEVNDRGAIKKELKDAYNAAQGK